MSGTKKERMLGALSVGLLLVAGLIVLVLGPRVDDRQQEASLVVGLVLTVGALLLAGTMLWVSMRHRSALRAASRYACPRCGLIPPPAELSDLQAAPCLRCGQHVLGLQRRGRGGRQGPAELPRQRSKATA